MGELKVETTNVSFRQIEVANKVLSKLSIEGLDDSVVADVLVAIARISEANESLEKKIKAINDKLPAKLKEYNQNPEKEYTDKEMSVINRYYGNWQTIFAEAREEILSHKSLVKLSDIQILSKEQITNWIKANKKEIKVTESAIIYQLMLKP